MQRPQTQPNYLVRVALIALALGLLARAVQPARIAADYQQAATLERAGQPDRAAGLLREVVARQPWRGILWERIARLELDANQPAAALEAFMQAEQHATLSADAWLQRGEAYLRDAQPEAAISAWQAGLDAGGEAALFYERIYRVQRDGGAWQAALVTAQEWHARYPENAWVEMQSGLLLLATGQQDTALPVLLEAARIAPEYSPTVETLREAIGQANLSDEPAYRSLVLGRALGSLGEWELAEQLILEATRIAPQYAEAWGFLGEARQNLGKDGYPDLTAAETLNPDSIIVQALLAVYWRRQDSPALAMRAIEKMIALEPDQVLWVIEAGNTQAELGDLIAARAYFTQAIEMEAGSVQAWKSLAAYSLFYGDDVTGTALPAARQALTLAPNDPVALDLMGSVFLALGDLVSAERFLQRAIQQDSTLASAHLHLGQVFLQKGDLAGALAPLNTALRLSPQGAEGRLAQRLLDEIGSTGP